jgi:hypothetical protein
MYAQHVERIIASHGLTVTAHSRGGRANRRRKTIAIRPVKTAITYAVALHELGHVLGKSAAHRLDREANAWKWAKENAIEWTGPMETKMRACLLSYQQWQSRKEASGVNVCASATLNSMLAGCADAA